MSALVLGRRPLFEGQHSAPCGCYPPVCQLVRVSATEKKRYFLCLNCGEFSTPGDMVEETIEFVVLSREKVEAVVKDPEKYMALIKAGPKPQTPK